MSRIRYTQFFFMPLVVASIFAAVAGGVEQDKSAQTITYLKPSTAEVGGIHHLCLIYHGQKRRVPWTADALLPYVAYVDAEGKPKDWLFDSFLMIEFATDTGVSLYHDAAKAAKPTAADWQWLADCWFREKTGLVGLEEAVAKAGRVLGEPDRKVNVMITMPLPQKSIRKFGPLPGQDKVLDFANEQDRRQALKWYVAQVLDRYGQRDYPHLRLLGFYWTQESIPKSDYQAVTWMSEYLHEQGYKFYWIPYYNAAGFNDWKRLGFDAVMLQPNHFFHKKSKPSRLMHTARRAQIGGSGVEMEFDARMMSPGPDRDLFVEHFYDYLDAGVKYGWMTDSVLGWYEGGGTIKRFLDNPQTGRKYYDDVYRFIKGTYKPTGRKNLPKLTVINRDNSKN